MRHVNGKEGSMSRFNEMKGIFGLLPTPYDADGEVLERDLRALADFCCMSGQTGSYGQLWWESLTLWERMSEFDIWKR